NGPFVHQGGWPRRTSNGQGGGNERVSGPAGTPFLAQPPCSAERGRPSPHECWVRLVWCPDEGPPAASAAASKPGRRRAAFSPAAVTPGPAHKKRHRSREGELLSLDFESLMRVRRQGRRSRTHTGRTPASRGLRPPTPAARAARGARRARRRP